MHALMQKGTKSIAQTTGPCQHPKLSRAHSAITVLPSRRAFQTKSLTKGAVKNWTVIETTKRAVFKQSREKFATKAAQRKTAIITKTFLLSTLMMMLLMPQWSQLFQPSPYCTVYYRSHFLPIISE